MFIHHVYFYTMPQADPEATEQLVNDCRHNLSRISGVVNLWAGPPVPGGPPNEAIDTAFAVALAIHFTDKAAHDAYQVHPIHEAFVATHRAIWAKVRVFDFEGSAPGPTREADIPCPE